MENKYIILSRYEVWTSYGKDWTKWFAYNTTPMSEKEANEVIKNTKKDFDFIDQKTKLKHEYMLKDNTEYLNEQKEMIKHIEEVNKKQAEYYKSDEYKELQKKKRQSAKERKERQKKYAVEHGIQ